MSKTIYRLFKFLIAYTFLLLICYYPIKNYINNFNPFKIEQRNIIIIGNKFYNEDEIMSLINDLTNNKNILEVETIKIKNKLESNSIIDEVIIYKKIPSYLFIEINERNIIAKNKDNEKHFFIDNNGRKVFPKNEYDEVNIDNHFQPILIKNEYKISDLNYQESCRLINFLSTKLPYLYNDLDEIIYYKEKIELSFFNQNSKVFLDKKNYINNIKSLIGFIEQIEKEDAYSFSMSNYDYINTLVNNQMIIKDKPSIVNDQTIEDEIN